MYILRVSTILTISILIPCLGFSGWFGANNFEECVLEKMKGQNKSLINFARKACENKFPYEKEIDLDKENIKISWSNEGGYLSITVKKRSDNYILTRIDAIFSKKDWTEINGRSDYNLSKTFTFSPDPNIAGAIVEVHDPESYKTMAVEKSWGIMK